MADYPTRDWPPSRPEPPPPADPVFRPAHYSQEGIDPVTFSNANRLNINESNVVKYVTRARRKGYRVEDLNKARRYIEIELECIRRDERVKAGEPFAVVWSTIL